MYYKVNINLLQVISLYAFIPILFLILFFKISIILLYILYKNELTKIVYIKKVIIIITLIKFLSKRYGLTSHL